MNRPENCPKGHGRLQDLHTLVPWCAGCAWTPPGTEGIEVPPPRVYVGASAEAPIAAPRRVWAPTPIVSPEPVRVAAAVVDGIPQPLPPLRTTGLQRPPWYGQPQATRTRRRLPPPPCAAANCDRLATRRGFCNLHYGRVWRTGSAELLPRPATCLVEGCERAVKSRGLCGYHYLAWRKTQPKSPHSERIAETMAAWQRAAAS